MQGIVSMLDDASAQATRALWAELEREHGLREAAQSTPYPHVSFHLAEDYDLARIGMVMRSVAARTAPLAFRITGLGAFTTFEPVLYLAVERSPALDALHASLWRELANERVAREPSPLYASASWIPHVTLAQRDLTPKALETLMTAWSSRDFRWDVFVSDLTLLYWRPGEASYAPLEQVMLRGRNAQSGPE